MRSHEGEAGIPEEEKEASDVPTEKEMRKDMSDDELRAKDPYWTAYYLVIGSRGGFESHPDPWGTAKERLRGIFPDFSEDRIRKLMEGASTRWMLTEGQDNYASPEEDK